MDALPPSIAGTLQDLQRRISILERANKLVSSSIVGGSLRVLDDDGNEIVVLGDLSGVNGIRLNTTTGDRFFEVNQTNGFGQPWIATPWRPVEDTDVTHDPAGFAGIVNGTFRRAYANTIEALFSTEMLFRVRIECPVGVTAEVRVWNEAGAAILGSTLSISASTDAIREFRIAHGGPMLTGPYTMYVEGRITSGAGPFWIYEPGGAHWGAAMAPVAGGWVP